MKSIFLCLFFLIVFFQSTFSQSRKFEVGIVAGPSLSFLFGNELYKDFGSKPIVRYAFGAKLDYHYTNSLAFEGNIIYERKGNSLEFQLTDATGSPIGGNSVGYTYFDYLSIPILFKPSFGEKVKFFLAIGPNFSILLKNTSETYIGTQLNSSTDMTKFNNTFDLGLTTGIGLLVPLSERFNFSIELRNNLGLLNISKVGVYGGSGTVQSNSTNLLLSLSYKL